MFGILLDDRVEALGPALRAGMAERALGHDDLALAAHLGDQRLGDRRAHELVVGRQEAVHVDLVEGRDQRVHVDDRRAGIDHLLHRLGQRADAEGLDGDEVPFLRGHVVDRGALLDGVELAVEPGHLDIEELAPVFGRRLALGAPGGLQAGIGEGSLERLLRAPGRDARGHGRADAEDAKCRDRSAHRRDGEKVTPAFVQRVRHRFLLGQPVECRCWRESGSEPYERQGVAPPAQGQSASPFWVAAGVDSDNRIITSSRSTFAGSAKGRNEIQNRRALAVRLRPWSILQLRLDDDTPYLSISQVFGKIFT